jgi:cell division protein FtsI/penicillin-binding protein 2
MTNRVQMRRLAWLALLLGAAFAGLGYRLVDLQVLRHDELAAKAQKNVESKQLLKAHRGDILDAKGKVLATSITVKTVGADPTLLGNRQADVARVLAPLLQMPESQLCERLTPKLRPNDKGEMVRGRFVALKENVPLDHSWDLQRGSRETTWPQIQAAMTNLSFGLDETKLSRAEKQFYQRIREKAVYASDDQLRVYPNQRLAAHVIGYLEDDNGKDGIERTLNAKLAGVNGWRETEVDRLRHEVVTRREQQVEAHHGLNAFLTIDSVIQNIVESELADAMAKHTPISISGIVVRPRTGEILALATLPDFDPNNTRATSFDALRDRVIADFAEPGSTFKIVVVSGALNDGAVRLTDTFDCEHGHFFFANRTLHDHESYGVLSVQEIITKSSNIGAAKVGIKLGANRLYDYIRDFGFGEPTGIPLPGEVSAAKYVKPVSDWKKVSIAQIPMGHGICVTRMQMVMAMCALANNGVLMRPMLVDRLEDRDHKVVAKYAPQRVRQVISEATARLMVKALKTVVTPEGTAAKAALDHYTAAGKTGTAEKVENGHYVKKYFTSFIGFFPADNPELCISVTLDEPKGGYYGGQVAAPIFKQIAERAAKYLSIPPEDPQVPSIPDSIAAPVDTRMLRTAANPSN